MFENPLLERLSHVHPVTPLVLYAPIILACLFVSALYFDLSLGRIAVAVVLGYFGWTLLEYWLHRLLFHLPVRGELTKKIYFFVHGVHHDWPWDTSRLVLPPALSLTLAVLFYSLFRATLPGGEAHAAFGGLLSGYLVYDMLHWYSHVGAPQNRLLKHLRKEHMIHHFKEPKSRFGVSCPWWDWVFRTTGKAQKTAVASPTEDQGHKGAAA